MSLHTNKLIIIAAPSGAGKTTVTRHLLYSFATRIPRENENDGVDYYFITPDEFRKRIEEHQFVEWEMVYHNKFYGTLHSELNRIWEDGKYPLLDVDVKGGINIQTQYRNSSLSLFIEPPSIEELEKRLKARGTETPDSLKARIEKASFELTFKNQFDHIIVNDTIERACHEAEDLVRDFLAAP